MKKELHKLEGSCRYGKGALDVERKPEPEEEALKLQADP